MDPLTIALFVVLGITLLADLGFAFLFLRTAELREGPGLMILVQAQAQVVLDLHWLTIKAVWRHKTEPWCQIAAFINYFCFTTCFGYSAAICVASSQHFEKPRYPSLWLYHCVVLISSLVLCLIMMFTGVLGSSTFGTCTLVARSWAE